MKPEFGFWREQHNELFLKQYENPHGVLHPGSIYHKQKSNRADPQA